jgi:serine/threonine-protein kinase ULK/ATG1
MAQSPTTPTGGSSSNGGTTTNLTNFNSLFNRSKSFDQFVVADLTFKRGEQLVIYLKCLQLLKPMLSYARNKLMSNQLKSTQKVRKLMRQLNNMYKFCLYQSKNLYNSDTMRSNKYNLDKIYMNADRLLYIHAIELCREAAMDEFFGKPCKCIKLYKEAHLIFHCLSQQSNVSKDKQILNGYRDAVERRLYILQEQGFLIT